MVEFNPDGSIKMPARMAVSKEKLSERMRSQQAFKVRKCVGDKECVLEITRSAVLRESVDVQKIFDYFECATPMKLVKLTEKDYQVLVGKDFSRCRECTAFVERLRSVVDGNLILEKGACTYGDRMASRSFSYEDYFD